MEQKKEIPMPEKTDESALRHRCALYTRGGDRGRTSLADGRRVQKDCATVEAVGALDELTSHVGLLAAIVTPATASRLCDIQRRLMDIGATAHCTELAASRIHVADIRLLESEINRLDAYRGVRSGFVLPGGSVAAAQAHVCRAVCRRAERRALTAGMLSALPYLNRLSDYFYALASELNYMDNVSETKYP